MSVIGMRRLRPAVVCAALVLRGDAPTFLKVPPLEATTCGVVGLRQLGMVALRLNMVGAEAVAPDGSECGRGLARARVACLCYMGSESVG